MAVRIGSFISGWVRRVVATMMEFATPSNSTVRSRWLRSPELRHWADVCVFVIYAPGNMVSEHSRFHARAWADAGFCVVVVLNTDRWAADVQVKDLDLDFASGVLVRENRGYDFGAWASALEQLPALRTASLVALANDSMYGPLSSFPRMIERARALDADVVGATESFEFQRHFQSFLLFFKPGALNSDAFWRFWRKIRAGGRTVAVYRYELGLVKMLESAGLRCVPLFPSSDRRNPTLTRWRSLIDEGFPYLKIALLRENTFDADLRGWEETLREHGYDPALATRHQVGAVRAAARVQSSGCPQAGP